MFVYSCPCYLFHNAMQSIDGTLPHESVVVQHLLLHILQPSVADVQWCPQEIRHESILFTGSFALFRTAFAVLTNSD